MKSSNVGGEWIEMSCTEKTAELKYLYAHFNLLGWILLF